MSAKEISLDERGRTSLAKVRSHDFNRYTVEEYPDGTLVLTPAVSVSALELAALRDEKVRAAIKQAKSGDRRNLRSRRQRRPAK
jgi:hypothetical protein